MTNPHWTATRWGCSGLVAGALIGAALTLPLRPDHDEGFAQLGWLLLALAVGALLALVGGSAAIHQGLRRAGDPLAGRTALVFVPVALVLAGVSAGIGALAAPAAARWVVEGFTRPAGWGPRSTGLAQRLVVTVVGCLLLLAWALPEAGHELGGRVGGAVLTWAAVVPVVVLLPVLLLRKVVPWPLLTAGVVVAAALLAPAVPRAVADAKPTPERLEQIAAGLGGGQVSTQVRRGSHWDVPISTVEAAGGVEQWQEVLRRDGWTEVKPVDAQVHFLPEDVRTRVEGRPQWAKGLWLRASVLPAGDGVQVLLTVRP